MNFQTKETVIGGEINFLDSSHVRYIRGAITLDAASVTADGNGLKKLPGGTFIGKQGNNKWAKYTPATFATLATGVVASNNAITFTAKKGGTSEHAIKIQLRDPGAANQALKVTLEGDTIVVSLATDGTSTITSTAAQVIAAVNAAITVKDLVVATNTGASTGAGVVAAVAATALAGAVDANVTPTLLLAHDAVFTQFTASGGAAHYDQVVTAIDGARVITSRLPVAPDAVVKANMPGITFA